MTLPESLLPVKDALFYAIGDKPDAKRVAELSMTLAYTQGRMDQVHITNMALAGVTATEPIDDRPSPQS